MFSLTGILSAGKIILVIAVAGLIAWLWISKGDAQKSALTAQKALTAGQATWTAEAQGYESDMATMKSANTDLASQLALFQKQTSQIQAVLQTKDAQAATLQGKLADIQTEINNAPASTCKSARLAAAVGGLRQQQLGTPAPSAGNHQGHPGPASAQP